jgi:hypothetical protein
VAEYKKKLVRAVAEHCWSDAAPALSVPRCGDPPIDRDTDHPYGPDAKL